MWSISNKFSVFPLIFFVMASSVSDGHSQVRLPRFEDYPARKTFTGKPAPVKFSTRRARRYRTALANGAKKGSDFAGHFTIVSWGCGTACSEFAVVNAKTGDVYFPPFFYNYGLIEMPESLKDAISSLGQEYRIDSRLFIAHGSKAHNGKGIHFYRWDGNRFTFIRSVF
jgi:hypothetical protein